MLFCNLPLLSLRCNIASGVDSGNPSFGPISVVFNASYARPSTYYNAVDCGVWEGGRESRSEDEKDVRKRSRPLHEEAPPATSMLQPLSDAHNLYGTICKGVQCDKAANHRFNWPARQVEIR